MAEALVKLILIVIVVVFVPFLLKEWRRRIKWQKLRDNPPPRGCMEVCLPGGITDANTRMQSFYRRIHTLVDTNDKERAKGLKTMHVVYYATRQEGYGMPQIRFLIYCDVIAMETVKRALQTAFAGMAEITVPETDPLAHLREVAKPPPPPPPEVPATGDDQLAQEAQKPSLTEG